MKQREIHLLEDEDDEFPDLEKDQLLPREGTDTAAATLSERPAFQCAVGILILLNTLLIALEAAWMQRSDIKPMLQQLELVFTCLYTVELAVRLWERGVCRFFCGADGGWNTFDFVITSIAVADAASSLAGVSGNSGADASVARLFRVLRVLRVFRAFRFLGEIDYIVLVAGRAILKLGLLVVLVIFVAAIVTTNLLGDSRDEKVAAAYSSLGTSMWSMFKLMTLDNWADLVDPAVREKPAMLPAFVLFIFVGSIALVSLVPAIFLEMNFIDRERAEQQRAQYQKEAVYASKEQLLKRLFAMVDYDRSGSVCGSEMHRLLRHSAKLRELRNAGLTEEGDLNHLKLALFDLWEAKHEEHGRDDVEFTEQEFLRGVLGTWSDVNDQILWRSITSTRKLLRDHTRSVQRQLQQIEKVLQHIVATGTDDPTDLPSDMPHSARPSSISSASDDGGTSPLPKEIARGSITSLRWPRRPTCN